MKSSATGHTVAEQVAALPPLSQLLGLDNESEARDSRATSRVKRNLRTLPTTSTASTGFAKKAAGPKSRSSQGQTATHKTATSSSVSPTPTAAALKSAKGNAGAATPSARATPATTPSKTNAAAASGTTREVAVDAAPQSRPPSSSPSGALTTTTTIPTTPTATPTNPNNTAATTTTASAAASAATARLAGGLREWRHVQSTLQLPLAYRGEDDIALTLRLLRALPFFAPLLDHDLLTLAEAMELAEVAEGGTVVLRKRLAPPPPPLTMLPPLPGTAARTSTSTTAASGASAGLPVHPLTPSAVAAGSTFFLSDDDDDAAAAARPSWMMPAAELFQHFRTQMAQGDQPSLPEACLAAHTANTNNNNNNAAVAASGATLRGSRGSRGKTTVKRVSHNDAAPATKVRAAAAADLDTTTPPLFDVPEGWEVEAEAKFNRTRTADDDDERDAEEPFVVVLLSGHCELRWPRQRGPGESASTPNFYSYNVQPGDAMGYALVWAALPPGAQYVTCDTCVLLKVGVDGQSHEIRERLHRACRRANEAVYKAQRAYLAEKLHTPLFTNAVTAPLVDGEAGPGSGEAEQKAREREESTTSRLSSTTRSAANPAATREGGVLPSDALLDVAARQLIPIRVSSETVLLQEGLSPATECALFFVVEGTCSVVRRLWSQDQQRLEARRLQLIKELTPANGARPVLSTMPSTTTMEVAQLRPGDYCGDLAYLRLDPDHAGSIDAEWTAAYWQTTLVPPAALNEMGEDDNAAESTLASSLRHHRLHLQSGGGEKGGGNQDGKSSGGQGDGVATSKSLFRRHKSTVVTQRSARLFVLLPSAAAEVVRGEVLERMMEHARTYPSYTALLTEYEKLYKWAIYKEKVLYEQSKKAPVPLR